MTVAVKKMKNLFGELTASTAGHSFYVIQDECAKKKNEKKDNLCIIAVR